MMTFASAAAVVATCSSATSVIGALRAQLGLGSWWQQRCACRPGAFDSPTPPHHHNSPDHAPHTPQPNTARAHTGPWPFLPARAA
jgi:hypothetical protein